MLSEAANSRCQKQSSLSACHTINYGTWIQEQLVVKPADASKFYFAREGTIGTIGDHRFFPKLVLHTAAVSEQGPADQGTVL